MRQPRMHPMKADGLPMHTMRGLTLIELMIVL
ncbi:MAG: prepilin-type N-terminal cleavage/methylation domain-containing protein, partial [Betaproteobacteria bacterium]|nr:prepilin-type N-terminal cleavage/methylation domain-containing protein [Betaproteobacteria bacterium]